MKVNGYEITKCSNCKKIHYIINNPLVKSKSQWKCDWMDVYNLTQAKQRAKQLPKAKLVAEIYNYNSQFNYN